MPQSIPSNWLSFKRESCISENTGEFSLRDRAALTKRIHCTSQHGALVNRFPVMMTLIGWREFPTIFWSALTKCSIYQTIFMITCFNGKVEGNQLIQIQPSNLTTFMIMIVLEQRVFVWTVWCRSTVLTCHLDRKVWWLKTPIIWLILCKPDVAD